MIGELKFFVNNLIPNRKSVEIFTDGSHKGRWGSWAFVVVKNEKIIFESSGRERKTNSQRMEFQAALEALKYLPAMSRAVINTDSKVLLDCFTEARKRVAANQDQVEVMDQLLLQHNISWRWVKAHHGNVYNERCDVLCSVARKVT